MTTHTSGPWVWVEGSDAINCRWNNLDWTVASVGNHRLGWHEDKNSEAQEAGANARLIAIAPELMAACQAFVIYDNDDASNGISMMLNYQKARTAIRAAIAKATGVPA